jgi:hypothetical protein
LLNYLNRLMFVVKVVDVRDNAATADTASTARHAPATYRLTALDTTWFDTRLGRPFVAVQERRLANREILEKVRATSLSKAPSPGPPQSAGKGIVGEAFGVGLTEDRKEFDEQFSGKARTR